MRSSIDAKGSRVRHHWAAHPDGTIFCIECGYRKPADPNYCLTNCDELIQESTSHDWELAQMSDCYICRKCGEVGIWNELMIVPANHSIVNCSEKLMRKVLT